VPRSEEEHERGDDDRVAVERDVPVAMAGRGIELKPDALRGSKPQKPPPPFGNFTDTSSSVIAPAAMRVTRARYSPLSRSAGRPMTMPSTPVRTPVISSRIGNGTLSSNRKCTRSENHAPAATSGIWHSE
jgi:hypothetical protein